MAQRLCAAPYLLWSVIFIVVPLGVVAYYAFTDGNGTFTLNNISAIADYGDTLLLSVWLGAVATVISLVIAYPIAYMISRMPQSKQRIMIVLVMLPMWMNLILRTYALMTILEDTGIINSLLSYIGIGPIHVINTRAAVVIGMVYNFIPYMILPLYTVMTKIDKNLIEAAQDLGGSAMSVFKRVVLPLSVPGIASGVTMVFVPSVSTFYISQKLGGNLMLIGDVIDTKFNWEYNYNVGAALSLVLMVMIFICIAIMNQYTDGEGETMVV